jgi:hypothetical protein
MALAKELAYSSAPLEELVCIVYSRRPGWDRARIELRADSQRRVSSAATQSPQFYLQAAQRLLGLASMLGL